MSGKNNKEIEEIIIKDIKTLKSYTARKIEGTVTEMQNEDENRRLEYNNAKSDLRTTLNSAIDTKNDISMEVNDLIDQLALYKSEISAMQQKILDADSSTGMSNMLINEQKGIVKDELTKIPFFEVCIARKKGIDENEDPGNIDDKMNHEISKLAIGNQLGMKIVKQTIIKDGTLNAETVRSVLAGKANANLTLAQIPVEQDDGSILFDRYLYGLVTVYPFQEKDVSLATTPGMGGIDIEFDILNTTSQGIAKDLPSDEKRRLSTLLNDKKIKNGDSESQVKRLARTAKRLIATENSKISRNTKNKDDYNDQIKNIEPLIDDLGSQLNELDGEQQLANAKFHVAKTEYEKHVFNESYVEVFPWEGYISADASIMDSYASFAVESFQEFLTSIKSEYLREETELAGESFSEVKESKKSNVKLNEIKLLGKFAEKKEQIISEKTSIEINSMLRKVVNLDEGTANFANIEGYEVAGKTGTAIKYNSNAKLNTFVSLFPASKPNYVLLVMLDEPKPAPNFVYEFPPSEKFPNGYKHKGETRNTSGWNTVVVAGRIIEKIGPILAINNLQASKNF